MIALPPYRIGGSVEPRIALAATIDVAGHAVRIFNVHLDTRINAAERIEQLRAVLKRADSEAASEVIIGGDFNSNPFRWLNHTLPIWYSDQAGAIDRFMRASGYATPVAGCGSTITTRALRMHLDSIYVRGLMAGAFRVERNVRVSDRVPLWLDVRLK